MARDEDEGPSRASAHVIGQDLSLLSVDELNERIAMLLAEVERLKAAEAGKRASRDAASAFFKR